MTTSETTQSVCLPSLKILGDFWTLRIIDELSDGKPRRFTELERQLGSVNTVTLSKRLKDMQADRLIVRTEHSRADVSYRLTKLGTAAIPILRAVNEFSAAVKKH